jgi:hypothetical protein
MIDWGEAQRDHHDLTEKAKISELTDCAAGVDSVSGNENDRNGSVLIDELGTRSILESPLAHPTYLSAERNPVLKLIMTGVISDREVPIASEFRSRPA